MTSATPHRRLNRLTGEWVLVSPQRTQRPWLGQLEPPPVDVPAAYDPGCYLCPGNERAGRHRTPDYDGAFVFDNDFPALLSERRGSVPASEDGLLQARPERGICRVVCYSPRHDLSLGQMPVLAVRRVVDTWAAEAEELGRIDWVGHVQVFENRGAAMGASNPHPHGQIWAQESLPGAIEKEVYRQRAHFASGSCLLCDYAKVEVTLDERIVLEGDGFLAVVPFWATWPYETLLLPRRHVGELPSLTADERDALARMLRRLSHLYDSLFGVPFPYSMGWHQSPTDGVNDPAFHLHAHFYPPLLRSASVRKFMVGYELLGESQRDLTPEAAAEHLRAVVVRNG